MAEEDPPVVIKYCRSLYSYTAQREDELQFDEGDVIYIISEGEDGWSCGYTTSHPSGFFPSNYVEDIDEFTAEEIQSSKSGYDETGAASAVFTPPTSAAATAVASLSWGNKGYIDAGPQAVHSLNSRSSGGGDIDAEFDDSKSGSLSAQSSVKKPKFSFFKRNDSAKEKEKEKPAPAPQPQIPDIASSNTSTGTISKKAGGSIFSVFGKKKADADSGNNFDSFDYAEDENWNDDFGESENSSEVVWLDDDENWDDDQDAVEGVFSAGNDDETQENLSTWQSKLRRGSVSSATGGKPTNVGNDVVLSSVSEDQDVYANNSIVVKHNQVKKARSWKDTVDDSIKSTMSKQEIQRQEAIYETILTESDYVNDLKTIILVFVEPMKKKKLLNAKNLAVLFSNLEQLLPINEELLAQLQHLQEGNAVVEDIGSVFLTMADFFKVYTLYCSNFEHAIILLDKESKNKSVKQFLDNCLQSEECRNTNLSSFLIKPVQRICKYPLLLREILRGTDKSHKDYANIQKALSKIETVVTVVNEAGRAASNSKKILDLQSVIKTKEGEPLELVGPSRKLLRQSSFNEIVGDRKVEERELFLFSDFLLITRPSKNKYTVMSKIPFDTCMVNDMIEENEFTAFAFEIIHVGHGKYFLAALTNQQRIDWIDDLVNLTRDHLIRAQQEWEAMQVEDSMKNDDSSEEEVDYKKGYGSVDYKKEKAAKKMAKLRESGEIGDDIDSSKDKEEERKLKAERKQKKLEEKERRKKEKEEEKERLRKEKEEKEKERRLKREQEKERERQEKEKERDERERRKGEEEEREDTSVSGNDSPDVKRRSLSGRWSVRRSAQSDDGGTMDVDSGKKLRKSILPRAVTDAAAAEDDGDASKGAAPARAPPGRPVPMGPPPKKAPPMPKNSSLPDDILDDEPAEGEEAEPEPEPEPEPSDSDSSSSSDSDSDDDSKKKKKKKKDKGKGFFGGKKKPAAERTELPSLYQRMEERRKEMPVRVIKYELQGQTFIFLVRIKQPGTEGPPKFVKRKYADFYQLHMNLISAFPNEAGVNDVSVRIIPELPAQIVLVTEEVAQSRLTELDAYCQKLYSLPEKISKSDVAMKFLVDEVKVVKRPAADRLNHFAMAQQRIQSRRAERGAPPIKTVPGAEKIYAASNMATGGGEKPAESKDSAAKNPDGKDASSAPVLVPGKTTWAPQKVSVNPSLLSGRIGPKMPISRSANPNNHAVSASSAGGGAGKPSAANENTATAVESVSRDTAVFVHALGADEQAAVDAVLKRTGAPKATVSTRKVGPATAALLGSKLTAKTQPAVDSTPATPPTEGAGNANDATNENKPAESEKSSEKPAPSSARPTMPVSRSRVHKEQPTETVETEKPPPPAASTIAINKLAAKYAAPGQQSSTASSTLTASRPKAGGPIYSASGSASNAGSRPPPPTVEYRSPSSLKADAEKASADKSAAIAAALSSSDIPETSFSTLSDDKAIYTAPIRPNATSSVATVRAGGGSSNTSRFSTVNRPSQPASRPVISGPLSVSQNSISRATTSTAVKPGSLLSSGGSANNKSAMGSARGPGPAAAAAAAAPASRYSAASHSTFSNSSKGEYAAIIRPTNAPPPPPAAVTQSSVASAPAAAAGAEDSSAIRVKVQRTDNNQMFAFKVLPSWTYTMLYESLSGKISPPDGKKMSISYKDEEGDVVTILEDDDLQMAVEQCGGKLLLYVAIL